MKITVLIGKSSANSVFQTLAESVSTDIKGVWIKDTDAETAQIAEAFDIPIVQRLGQLLSIPNIDLIIDLSESEDVAAEISEHNNGAEVVDHSSARLICRLLESEGRKTHDLIDELTREHWALYEIGTNLSSAKDLSDVYKVIVRQATKLTNTPVGSLAVYDQETREMYFTASMGFRGEIATQDGWKLRTGGLTSYILNQKDAVAISNIDEYPQFNNPQLIKEGIKSLIACPLLFEGKVIGIIYVDDYRVRDFTERDISILSLVSTYAVIAIEKAKLLEETKILAVTDDLTKLYNHRYLIQQLTKELNRAKRYKEPLSFIMMDIDHFKQYNDNNGHEKGNELLVELARLLKAESRESDIIARYGGEEFAIICPKTNKQNAFELAERLRRIIELFDFPCACAQPCGRITVSFGVASHPGDASEVGELIDRADSGLYLAKREGRNRVCAA